MLVNVKLYNRKIQPKKDFGTLKESLPHLKLYYCPIKIFVELEKVLKLIVEYPLIIRK